MFLRILSFFVFIAFSLSSYVNAMPDERDLVIVCHLTPHKKRVLFENAVYGVIPGKVTPDPYHLTLGIVKNVKLAELNLLGSHLESLARLHLSHATFTATAAKRYLVNRAPHLCPLVLSPTVAEANSFKNINVVLHNALQVYNVHRGKQYVFAPDVVPGVYDPHITLVNTHYIQSHVLDRDVLINRINARIQGRTFQLLETMTPPPPPAHRCKSATHRHVAKKHERAASKHRRAAGKHRRAARKHIRAAHKHKHRSRHRRHR